MFQLTGDETPEGEGSIIQDMKGRGDNLSVKKDQLVSIIRMANNPKNKWLCRIGESSKIFLIYTQIHNILFTYW